MLCPITKKWSPRFSIFTSLLTSTETQTLNAIHTGAIFYMAILVTIGFLDLNIKKPPIFNFFRLSRQVSAPYHHFFAPASAYDYLPDWHVLIFSSTRLYVGHIGLLLLAPLPKNSVIIVIHHARMYFVATSLMPVAG